jgi:REP element-mobilizing transposase RayT
MKIKNNEDKFECLLWQKGKHMKRKFKNNLFNKNDLYDAYKKKSKPSQEEIIRSIDKIYHLKAIDDTYKLEDMLLTVEHVNYFISSEADMDAFAEKFYAVGEEVLNYFEENPDNDWLALWKFNDMILKLIKRFFDEEYFKNQASKFGILL